MTGEDIRASMTRQAIKIGPTVRAAKLAALMADPKRRANPIVLRASRGRYLLTDGHHRLHLARAEERATIRAHVLRDRNPLNVPERLPWE